MTALHDNSSRMTQLEHWLDMQFLDASIQIHPMKNDASFRHYYRCTINTSSYVVMDAPPDKENSEAFFKITQILSQFNILVPKIMAYDKQNGFMVLSDFGDTWLLEVLTASTPSEALAWYQKAITDLVQFQQIDTQPLKIGIEYTLPLFDAAHIMLELSEFNEWFIDSLLMISLNTNEKEVIENMKAVLVQSALQEPQVVIHLDYHSRNLMVLPEGRLGIIDYQDAKVGPLSYDLASLLKDCYITWSPDLIQACILHFYQQSEAAQYIPLPTLSEFITSFEFMALQRHLKVLGRFSRLKIRDNKPYYLKDIPRIIHYVNEVLPKHPQLSAFATLWHTIILPAFTLYQKTQEEPACAL